MSGIKRVAKKKKDLTPAKAAAELRYIDALRAPLRHELADANARLAKAEALLKSGEATMFENAKVVSELTEQLAGKERRLSTFIADIRELAAEVDYWQGEAANLRSELLAHIRDEARRNKPAADER